MNSSRSSPSIMRIMRALPRFPAEDTEDTDLEEALMALLAAALLDTDPGGPCPAARRSAISSRSATATRPSPMTTSSLDTPVMLESLVTGIREQGGRRHPHQALRPNILEFITGD